MTRRINEIELVHLPLIRIFHLYGMALDRDAPLALQIHIIQHLLLKIPVGQRSRLQQQLVGQRALPVIDMGYDTKIPDILHASVRSLFFPQR